MKIAFHDPDGLVDTCAKAVKTNMPVLLIGETGTGKTTLVRELAEKEGKTCHRFSLNGSTTVEEIVGFKTIKNGNVQFQDGLLIDAMNKGDWVVFDEINAALPEVLFCLHSLLDDDRKVTILEDEGRVVKPHPDFRFFATMNPTRTYAGTKEMSKAMLSRFGVVLHVAQLPPDIEQKILEDLGAKSNDAARLVHIARHIRELHAKEEVGLVCSMRELISCAILLQEGLTMGDVVEKCIISKEENPEERELLKREIGKIVKMRTADVPNYVKMFQENADLKVQAKRQTEEISKLVNVIKTVIGPKSTLSEVLAMDGKRLKEVSDAADKALKQGNAEEAARLSSELRTNITEHADQAVRDGRFPSFEAAMNHMRAEFYENGQDRAVAVIDELMTVSVSSTKR